MAPAGRTSPGDRREPLVSVIIPAFNAQATLDETLRSAAAQTHANLEILIVDDGSTDRTAAIAEAFCRDEPRARLLRKENGGVASARNWGIAEAAGDWIAPLDADDLWHPTKTAKQVAAAAAAAEPPGFVYCWYQHIDEEARVLASGLRQATEGRALAQMAYSNPVGNGSALLILRDALDKVGGYDTSLRARGGEGCEDLMIQLRIARDFPVAVVPEHLVGYRVHSQSMSQKSEQMSRSWRLVYEDLAAAGAIPASAARWTLGAVWLTLAETRLADRRFREIAGPVGRALLLDPVRTCVSIAYRLARLFVRLIRGRRTSRLGAPFQQMHPSAYVAPDVYRIPVLTTLLDAIDASRLRRLARLDQRRSTLGRCR